MAKKGIYGDKYFFCDFENTAIDIQIIALDTMIELTATSGMTGIQVSNLLKHLKEISLDQQDTYLFELREDQNSQVQEEQEGSN